MARARFDGCAAGLPQHVGLNRSHNDLSDPVAAGPPPGKGRRHEVESTA